MGTRGFVGFVVDGQEKIAYNHFDSYPEGLGVNVATWLRSVIEEDRLDEIRDKARALRLVTAEDNPTPDDIERLRPFTNLGVSERSTDDWYCLLRDTQGDPQKILDCGYMEDNHDFPLDSLFCEWGYLVDLDANTFEVYEGFQDKPHTEGRFADREPESYGPGDQYYPVKLVATFALTNLPIEMSSEGKGKFKAIEAAPPALPSGGEVLEGEVVEPPFRPCIQGGQCRGCTSACEVREIEEG